MLPGRLVCCVVSAAGHRRATAASPACGAAAAPHSSPRRRIDFHTLDAPSDSRPASPAFPALSLRTRLAGAFGAISGDPESFISTNGEGGRQLIESAKVGRVMRLAQVGSEALQSHRTTRSCAWSPQAASLTALPPRCTRTTHTGAVQERECVCRQLLPEHGHAVTSVHDACHQLHGTRLS